MKKKTDTSRRTNKARYWGMHTYNRGNNNIILKLYLIIIIIIITTH